METGLPGEQCHIRCTKGNFDRLYSTTDDLKRVDSNEPMVKVKPKSQHMIQDPGSGSDTVTAYNQ